MRVFCLRKSMSDNFKQELKERVSQFPVTFGVYLMKSKVGKIIYVGKAKNLKNRVRSYFSEGQDVTPKTKFLMSHVVEIDYILTQSEVEAFLLEASLIKKHRPKYNIRLKDDKAYPYIQITWSSDFPRLYVSRKVVKDGGYYFGPYSNSFAVQGTIRLLNRIFKVRDCTDTVFKTRKRPCMTHQIGRCSAPCVDLVDSKTYKDEIEGALLFLRGKNSKLLKEMNKKMFAAADEEKFEVAAKLRDSIKAIEAILEKQNVVSTKSEDDQDAVGFYGDERGTLIETVHVRQGRVIGTRAHFFPLLDSRDKQEDPREWLISFLNQYFEDNFIPDHVLTAVDLGLDMTGLLRTVLEARAGKKVSVRFPTDDFGRSLIHMANSNAQSHFIKYVNKSEEKKKGLEDIQDKLGLKLIPSRIECFDISHFQGKETVASQVVFEDGVPHKDYYRRYKLKAIDGNNDYASMKEVLTRRFSHKDFEDPQLLVIDGGKGQLGIAVKVLEELDKKEIPVVGLAKSRTISDFHSPDVLKTEERFFLPGRSNPVVFKENSEAYQILVSIRDEAHRFAINYHRKLREATSLESELDFVIGLGEARKKELLKHFSSVDAIRAAAIEDLCLVKGFNRVLAERILLQLSERDQADEVSE